MQTPQNSNKKGRLNSLVIALLSVDLDAVVLADRHQHLRAPTVEDEGDRGRVHAPMPKLLAVEVRYHVHLACGHAWRDIIIITIITIIWKGERRRRSSSSS
jgi:hypothetical protein